MTRKPRGSIVMEINRFQKEHDVSDHKISISVGGAKNLVKRIRSSSVQTKPETIDRILNFIDNYVAEDNEKRDLIS